MKLTIDPPAKVAGPLTSSVFKTLKLFQEDGRAPLKVFFPRSRLTRVLAQPPLARFASKPTAPKPQLSSFRLVRDDSPLTSYHSIGMVPVAARTDECACHASSTYMCPAKYIESWRKHVASHVPCTSHTLIVPVYQSQVDMIIYTTAQRAWHADWSSRFHTASSC